MENLNRILEIDPVSRRARIQAGIEGKDLERLRRRSFGRPHGLWFGGHPGNHYRGNHATAAPSQLESHGIGAV
ncbi:hypothetical protein [Marinobacter sp. es.048]|uniref:hypothetical protein n=1 Tax=Marinobacter sp. es.048 TaxID=1761795 RepID=UPI003A5CFAA5